MKYIESFILCRFFSSPEIRVDYIDDYQGLIDNHCSLEEMHNRLPRMVGEYSLERRKLDYFKALYEELCAFDEEALNHALRGIVRESREGHNCDNVDFSADLNSLRGAMKEADTDNAITNYIIARYFGALSGADGSAKQQSKDNAITNPKALLRSMHYIKRSIDFSEPEEWWLNGNDDVFFSISSVKVFASHYFHFAASTLSLYKSNWALAKWMFCLYQLSCLYQNSVSDKRLISFMPYSVYKINDIVNGEITVAHPSKMNDPVDSLLFPWMSCHHDSFEKSIKLATTKSMKNQIQRRFDSFKVFEDSYKYYRIRSFTNELSKEREPMIENTLMWSHYADEHRGIAIVYDFSADNLPKRGRGSYVGLADIQYASVHAVVDVSKNVISLTDALLKKSSEWAYENETRIMSYDCGREGDFHQLNIGKIVEVYFGDKCPDETIATVKKLLANYGSPINFYKMNLNPKDIYRLNKAPI